MFKVRVKAAHYNASDSRMEFLVRDRLSWLRFLAFDLVQPTPDATTIGMSRERLTRSGGLDALFRAFDHQLRDAGYLAMGTRPSMRRWSCPPRPEQRNTQDDKDAIRGGASAAEIWPDEQNFSHAGREHCYWYRPQDD